MARARITAAAIQTTYPQRLYATFIKSLLPILDLNLIDKSNQIPIQNHFNYLMSFLSPYSVHHTFSFLKLAIHKAYTLQMIPF